MVSGRQKASVTEVEPQKEIDNSNRIPVAYDVQGPSDKKENIFVCL